MVDVRPLSLDHLRPRLSVRGTAKRMALGVAWVLVSPLVVLAWFEERFQGPECERVFSASKELLAPLPGLLGQYMRVAFYWSACRGVSPDACFLFGSMVAHRDVVIGAGSVIGTYSIVGRADLGHDVLLAARVSILSDKYLHGRPRDRVHGHISRVEAERVRIGDGTWIGENAVVMVSVGDRCTIGAGAVVMRVAEDGSTLMGNPARRVDL